MNKVNNYHNHNHHHNYHHSQDESNAVNEYLRDQMTRYPAPDSLQPEHIRERISADLPNDTRGTVRRSRPYLYVGAAVAACLALVVAAAAVRGNLAGADSGNGTNVARTGKTGGDNFSSISGGDGTEASSERGTAAGNPTEGAVTVVKADGKEHTTYTAIYDVLKASFKDQSTNMYRMNGTVDANGAIEAGSDDSVSISAGSATVKESPLDYTDTDVQVNGVMESDLVKTDGRYLYVLRDPGWYDGGMWLDDDEEDDGDAQGTSGGVVIYDAEKGDAKKIARIPLSDDGVTYCDHWEMYLSGDTLFLIGAEYSNDDEGSDDGIVYQEHGAVKDYVSDIGYIPSGIYRTAILSYDVSNPKKPKRIAKLTQSGNLSATRLTGGCLYVFSNYSVWTQVRGYTEENGLSFGAEDTTKYIPSVDGEVLSEDSLYLPEGTDADNYLVMTSVDVSKPDAYMDKAATLGWSNTYYMGTENFYMTQPTWNNKGMSYTLIDKYHYENGQFTYLAHAKVKGEIDNSYCMHEYKNHFVYVYTQYEEKNDDEFVATNEYVTTNGLGILDEKLKKSGSIGNLGKDEIIYASYFIDNMAYFVTYRNTDPVFAVDISDPKNPKLKSELKLPGFSSYLHSFGTDKDGNTLLIGLGRGNKDATLDDEDITEDRVKLSLFTVDKNGNVEETQTIWEDTNTWNYGFDRHEIFVDEENGLIGYGFVTENWRDGDDLAELEDTQSFVLYQYKGGGFEKLLGEKLGETIYYGLRGVRIGSTFYILDTQKDQDEIQGYALKLYTPADK